MFLNFRKEILIETAVLAIFHCLFDHKCSPIMQKSNSNIKIRDVAGKNVLKVGNGHFSP